MARTKLTVETDKAGRITGYNRHEWKDPVTPERIGEYLDGDDWLMHEDEEYALDERGNLVHREVEVPRTLTLGHGVLLGSGIQFGYQLIAVRFLGIHEPARSELGPEEINIDDRVVVKNLDGKPHSLHEGVHIQHHAVVLGASVGRNTVIGPHSEIGKGSYLSTDVVIGANVEIGQKVSLSSGVEVGDNTRIHDDNEIYPGRTIGHDVTIHSLDVKLDMDVPPHSTLAPN